MRQWPAAPASCLLPPAPSQAHAPSPLPAASPCCCQLTRAPCLPPPMHTQAQQSRPLSRLTSLGELPSQSRRAGPWPRPGPPPAAAALTPCDAVCTESMGRQGPAQDDAGRGGGAGQPDQGRRDQAPGGGERLLLPLLPPAGCDPATLPACQPASLPACQPASLPACQPASLPACQPASLPASQPASLPACHYAAPQDASLLWNTRPCLRPLLRCRHLAVPPAITAQPLAALRACCPSAGACCSGQVRWTAQPLCGLHGTAAVM